MATSNARIVYTNAARRATVVASSTAGANAVARMLNGERTEGWRSTGTTATLTLTWAAPEPVQYVGFPLCDLSPTSTIRVRAYDAVNAVLHDSGAGIPAAPAAAVDLEGFTAAQALLAYQHGGGSYCGYWFPVSLTPAKIVVDITDTANPAGYIEVIHLVAGPYFETVYDIEAGEASVKLTDTSEQFRTAAGTLKARPATRYREMAFDLTAMPAADRKAVLRLLRRHGKRTPFLVSIDPLNADAEYVRESTVYGMLTDVGAMTLDGPDSFATTINIAEL